jgi:hypothetical protein
VRPAFLLSVVALLPSPALTVDFLLELAEPIQIRFAPQPHGPAVAYAQLRGLKPFGHNPAVQGHYRNARCFGGLSRVARLCHICDIYTIFNLVCKAFCFGHLSPVNWPAFTVGGAGQVLGTSPNVLLEIVPIWLCQGQGKRTMCEIEIHIAKFSLG